MFRRLTGALLLAGVQLSHTVWAQAPATLRTVRLDAQQQAALGIRSTPVLPASAASLLAAATVTVPPGQEVTVSAPMAGTIARLDAGLGDSVRGGTPLALLTSPQLADVRRQAREAELEARNAQAALQRDRVMHDEGIIPAARLQLTQNRRDAAEAAWQAQSSALRAAGLTADPGNYASGRIVAPRAGTVVDVQASVGQRVEAGAVLFRIADLHQLQLDIVLSGDKAVRLRAGDKVSIPSHDATATLIGVGRSLEASQQAHARARVTTAGRLQAGEAVQVQLQAAAAPAAAPAWQVPARAVLHLQDKNWVLLVSPQGFVPTAVQLVSSNDDTAVVQGPIHAQQRVVSTGLAALRPLLQKDE